MPSEHTIRHRVRFYETDLAGMVHFSWFFKYMEEAEHALWREAGLKIHGRTDGLRWPRVAASCDFRSPLHFEDEVDVSIRVAAITAGTIRYACSLTRGAVRIATGTLTVACAEVGSANELKAARVPDDVRAALQVASDAAI
jgi:4-hydroxybenzoyl-CoA thioesterase/acyl-CoA thioester hydrolase